MKLEEVDINSIKPYKNNPREISNDSVQKVMKSIKEFGNNQPIVVDQDNIIVVGHTRWKALKQLGKKKAYIVKKDFTKNNAIAYRIMDNRSGEESKWANKLLTKELEILKNEDFNLDLTGFESIEIDNFLLKDDLIIDTNIENAEYGGAINDIKMIQLFYNPENETKFRTCVEKISKKYKIDNISDAVLEALLNEANSS